MKAGFSKVSKSRRRILKPNSEFVITRRVYMLAKSYHGQMTTTWTREYTIHYKRGVPRIQLSSSWYASRLEGYHRVYIFTKRKKHIRKYLLNRQAYAQKVHH